jgi:hypothetical protein
MPDPDIAEKAVYAIINLAFIAIIWWVAIDEFFDWLRRRDRSAIPDTAEKTDE